MNSSVRRVQLGLLCAAALGVAASSGYPAVTALMCLMPVFTMAQTKRWDAFVVAASYYAGATWPVLAAARNFFGPDPPAAGAVLMWLGVSLLLAAPWPAVWTTKRRSFFGASH